MKTDQESFSIRREECELMSRREIGVDDPSLSPVKAFGAWLLWTGISPESKQPVSRIGIYTDFT